MAVQQKKSALKRTRKKQTSLSLKFLKSDNKMEQHLNSRCQVNVTVLEDVREYMKKRSALEAEYASGLKNLNSHFIQKRKWRALSEESPGKENILGDKTLLYMWKSFLEKSLHEAASVRKASDFMTTEFVERLRNITKNYSSKLGSRVVRESAYAYQCVQECAMELELSKKKYHDAVTLLELAMDRESALSTKADKVMSSESDLRLANARVKLKESKLQMENSKDEYLLAIEAAKAKYAYYYKELFPSLVMNLDSPLCTTLCDSFRGLGNMLKTVRQEELKNAEDLCIDCSSVTKEYEYEVFASDLESLRRAPDVSFIHSKTVSGDVSGSGAEGESLFETGDTFYVDERNKSTLELKHKKLKHTTERLEKDCLVTSKQYAGLVQMAEVSLTNPEFSNSKANSDIEKQLEESFEHCVSTQEKLVAAKSSMKLLERNGIGVKRELLELGKSASSSDLVVSSSFLDDLGSIDMSLVSAGCDEDEFSSIGESVIGKRCVALYNYEARHSDELSLCEDDDLFITDTVAGGWYEGRNAKGKSGLFPSTYVEILGNEFKNEGSSTTSMTSSLKPLITRNQTSPAISVAVNESAKPKVYTRSKTEGATPRGVLYARALYDNIATSDDELTFKAGSLVEIMSKETGEEGYWEGRIQNERGIFPSILVQPLHF